jgi:hypothetical protein
MRRMADPQNNNAQRPNGSQHVETTNDPDKTGRSAAKKKSK